MKRPSPSPEIVLFLKKKTNFKNPNQSGTNYKILSFSVLLLIHLARAFLKKCFTTCNKNLALHSINLPTHSVLLEFLTQTSICSRGKELVGLVALVSLYIMTFSDFLP